MPEMHFVVRWPDGQEMRCYSPSLVVRDYLNVGGVYTVDEFMGRTRAMLHVASERVRAKFGFACSSALDQLSALETCAAAHDAAAEVTVIGFELPDGVAPAAEVHRG